MTMESLRPQRTCSGCKKRFDQNELLAVTRLKNGDVIVNPDRKKSGRSAYLCKKPECLRRVHNRKGKNGLEYGLKVKIPDSVWEELQKIIK